MSGGLRATQGGDGYQVGTREQLGETAFTEAWEQGQALTLDEAVALALESLD